MQRTVATTVPASPPFGFEIFYDWLRTHADAAILA